MGKNKPSKAKKRVRALKQNDPTVVTNEDEWAQHEPEELKKAPHSFIVYRGKVGRYIKELMKDLRHVMEPYTASNLKMTKGNVLRDYVSIASYFHVTHLCMLSRTQISPYLKICKLPRGPTLSFRVLNYTLARDVLSSLRKQVTFDAQFQHHPLLIMNNFSSESKEHELISTTFQNMFPPININKVRVTEIRRVLLLNYMEEDDTIELRHFTITYKTTGVSKGIQKILLSKHGKIPNLGRCTEISDFIDRDGEISESEGEDMTETVGLPQKMSSKISKGQEEVGVKLVELGPRIRMQLIKVEDGLCEGEVLYHKLMEKTAAEKLLIRKQRNLKKSQKMARKREQEMNIDKKRKEKEENRKQRLEGAGAAHQHRQDNGENPEDDDREWYRKEVGEDPDEGTFTGSSRPGNLSERPQFMNRKRRAEGHRRDEQRQDEFGPPGQKVSKFTKVKEKAKQLKLDRQKYGVQGKGKGFGSKGDFKGSSKGTYSKPGKGGFKGNSSRGGSQGRGGKGGSRGTPSRPRMSKKKA